MINSRLGFRFIDKNKSANIGFVFVLFLLALSCEKIPLVEAEASDLTWKEEQAKLVEEGLRSEQTFRHPSMNEEQYQGAINAVKKAYQLTDITFTPRKSIAFNKGTYQPDTTYKGMIYSSVKEIGTYIGSDISFHTFMTAIHNPRSRIYTDRIDEPPYHGTNCRSYYGTVCSGLVSYALGLNYSSFDFVASDEMEELDYSDVDSFHIADVLWKSGHVAMITDVVRDKNDETVSIEISEAVQNGCKRYSLSRSSFQTSQYRIFKKSFRYKYLERNITYMAVPEFVPVFGETGVPFVYNDNICVDKGDRSCYFVGEDVVLNLLSSGKAVEIYKDGIFHSAFDVEEANDLRLSDLDYGFYQARLMKGDGYSGFTSWIMVDYTIEPSKDEMTIFYSSRNSRPVSIALCNQSGGRTYPFTEMLCRSFTEEEISLGFINIPQDKVKSDRPYFKITFETEFGRISTMPIRWL